MNPFDAYEQQQSNDWTRIDLLLAAFDGAIERLEKADVLMQDGQTDAAMPLLVRVQNIIVQLLGGLDPRHGEIPQNMRTLYIFVLRAIGLGDKYDLQAALNVLSSVREGLRGIRPEAVRLEHSGAILPVDESAPTLSVEIG